MKNTSLEFISTIIQFDKKQVNFIFDNISPLKFPYDPNTYYAWEIS